MNRLSSPSVPGTNIQRLIAKQTDELVRVLLSEGKITEPSWWASQKGRVWILVVVLLACLAISFAYQLWLRDIADVTPLPKSTDVAVTLITAAAIFFAYYQWMDGRRESSLDKFYDRLALINTRYYEWKEARDVVPHFWGKSTENVNFRPRMYVYLELDNLEYVILRYQLGYLRTPLLRRAVRTFSSRCESPVFCELAKEVVNGAGYAQATVDVVNVLVAQANPTRTIHIA